jgi:predicted anti-sigma-YlaC factor YlaD
MTELEHWDSFYVIVGGAAGALIGLQFVVMTLIADRPIKGASEASPAFSTPTIVHFSACLLLAALMQVPWHAPIAAAIAWGVVGLLGVFYTLLTVARLRQQKAYQPDREDWLFHGLFPLIAYLILLISAPCAETNEGESLFAVAAAALILLFIGIHNSWDSVVFISTGQHEKQDTADK